MSLVYRLGHTAHTTQGIHPITVVTTPAVEETTMVDPIVMTGDPTVTIAGRIEMIGMIGHIETSHIETMGDTVVIIGDTAMIKGTTGMTILTIARGADLAIIPGITVAADIMTTRRIMGATSP